EGRTTIDVGVPHATRRLVAGVIASDQLATERASETVDVGGPKVDTGSICGHCGDIGHEVTSGSPWSVLALRIQHSYRPRWGGIVWYARVSAGRTPRSLDGDSGKKPDQEMSTVCLQSAER